MGKKRTPEFRHRDRIRQGGDNRYGKDADRKIGPSPCLLESYGPSPEGFGPQGGRQAEGYGPQGGGPRYLLPTEGMMDNSISAGSNSGSISQPSVPAPDYKLFDYRAVGLATFFGTPAAGSILMALNYRRLGKVGAAAVAVAIGLTLTASTIFLASVAPTLVPTGVSLGLFFGVMYAAKGMQGAAVTQHTRTGGKLGSRWAAFGIGLAFLAAIFAALLAYFSLSPSVGTKVVIGSEDEIYYSGTATEQDAKALGQALQNIGFFEDRGVSVLLSKGKSGTAVSFAVQDGVWDDAEKVAIYEKIARGIAPSVGGLPLKLRLVNASLRTKKEWTVK